ncbi:hypothetical protein CGLAMM_08280 [Acetobacteraceae bacterium EV16G]|uniref:Uncharacterized protein n=1 Tax=Sorlinia euscelidii TaxID=3081148 RepID=A0ABU7U0A8_9PROT
MISRVAVAGQSGRLADSFRSFYALGQARGVSLKPCEIGLFPIFPAYLGEFGFSLS